MSSILKRAADQEQKYKLYFRVSLIFSLLILIAAFKFSPANVKVKILPVSDPDIIIVEPEIKTKQESEPPRPPVPPEPIISFSEDFEEIEFEETSLLQNEDVSLPPQLKDDRRIIIEEEEKIYIAVETNPQIIGGLEALTSKLYYSEIAKRTGIEGKVVVTIIVDKEGNVVDAQIVKSLHSDLDQIALKAVRELKFHPGIQNGKPVKVQVSIPIQFKLK
ncbi:MAG: energy transducer TonB [Ignavibacterium sp.]|nr:energy transducer TonB [Ignavibacterium sp.]